MANFQFQILSSIIDCFYCFILGHEKTFWPTCA